MVLPVEPDTQRRDPIHDLARAAGKTHHELPIGRA
jgi:hypothetical protein